MRSFSFQAHYFERDDVALPGFAKFFKESSDEEREHAQIFMKVRGIVMYRSGKYHDI